MPSVRRTVGFRLTKAPHDQTPILRALYRTFRRAPNDHSNLCGEHSLRLAEPSSHRVAGVGRHGRCPSEPFLRNIWLAPILSPAYEDLDEEKESRLNGLARDALGHAPPRASASVEQLVWELHIGLEERVSRLVSLDALMQSFPALKELTVRTVLPSKRSETEATDSKERRWSVVHYGFGDVVAPKLTSLHVTDCNLGSAKSLSALCPNLVSLRLCNSFFERGTARTTSGACFFPRLEKLYLVRDKCPFLDWSQMVPPGFGPVETISHVEISTHYLESIEFLTSFPRLYVLKIRFLNIDYRLTGHWRPLLGLWEICKSLRYVYLEGPETERVETFRSLVTEMRSSCPPHVELACKEILARFTFDEDVTLG